ncbi:MAG: DoxX family membrane protein [Actinomycetota bacterium]|nr:DoxX family membrane protein [Actinomycetota bacterium]
MFLRRVARPLLAATFVSSGIEVLLNPNPLVEAATPMLVKVQEVLPTERHVEPSTLVRADAAVKIGAGLMLAFGWAPRLAATALAASLIPTTVVSHPVWEVKRDDRTMQQIHFLKNAGLLGGLMLAAADTQGKPSVGWRARRAKRDAARAAKLARLGRREAARTAKLTRKAARARLAGAGAQMSALASKAGGTLPSLR